MDATARALREFVAVVVRSTRSASMSRVAAATLSLLERQGPLRITDLAEREAVTQPAMTGLVQRLEQAGHVARSPDPADGRASLISITTAGVAALGARRAEQDARIAAWLATLPPEQLATVESALPALTTAMEDHALV